MTQVAATVAIQGLGRELVQNLFVALRSAQLYDARNDTLRAAAERFVRTLEELLLVDRSARLEVGGDLILVNDVRIRSESTRDVFVGIGPDDDVEGYLDGVEHSVVTRISDEPEYSHRDGGAPTGPPADEDFWVASTSGVGEQTLEWEPEEGSWSAVVMNSDGSRGVSSELSIGAELDAAVWVGIAFLIVGAVLAALAALAITAGSRRRA